MNRLVILLCSHGHGSGAERVLEYFLSGVQSRRDEFCIVSPESSSVTKFAQDLGYDWVPWQAERDSLPQNIRAMSALVQRTGRRPLGSQVHVWHTRHLEWGLALGRLWRVPASGTLHDDPEPGHRLVGPMRRKIIRFAGERLDSVVAVSDALARRCAELGWNRHIEVIHNGLPDAAPTPIGTPEQTGRLRIGFMACGLEWKGVGLLPELVRRTADLTVDWKLFGNSSPDTQAAMDQLSTQPNVKCFGRVPLDEALAEMDVLLHLSLMFDPYPTVLLEAARAGLPVIATSTGGSPEIVRDSATGILVPPGDVGSLENAIRQLIQNQDLRIAMGKAARQRFESEFGVDRMVADYLSFWDRLRSSRK